MELILLEIDSNLNIFFEFLYENKNKSFYYLIIFLLFKCTLVRKIRRKKENLQIIKISIFILKV